MKFNVTYWVPAQYSAVAEGEEVSEALVSFIDKREPGTPEARRAGIVLTQLANGFEPTDLDIIASALEEYGFEGPKGTEPDRTDEATDYTAEVRVS